MADTQTAPAKDTEELTEQHRTGHSAWEDSGLDTVLKAEPENDVVDQRLQDTGCELRAERLINLSYEYVTYGRSSQQQAFFGQGITTNEDPACSYGTVTDSESLPVDSGLRTVEKDANIPPIGSLDVKPGAVIVDSAPNMSENDMISGTVYTKHRHYKEHRDITRTREELLAESVTLMCSPHSRMTVKENIALSKSNAQDVIGYALHDESFTTSKKDMACHKASARERRFICSYCGKSFTCPKNLETHQRVHTGEKPFSCTQCGKRFSDSSNRKRHQIIHTGERPYSCTLCGKRFTQSSCLIAHQRVHTGEKPFSCTQCGKRFADSSNLKRHQSVHIGKKPLSCTLWDEFNCLQPS
ncbi:zinc finger protein with KRAB and SCAN domains 1-like [Megalops cyprinoides]|uniref:zinc finger protein with KRAB and SCAN domains 1-like n=1 Tax=Megalops cyprinoides TaxID=118141 RepID=UPI001865158F|nr:zinc finger protein with KRAB and SCAN domains 1-like [Megalops cyprinoides]